VAARDDRKEYDVMVRVAYSYENMYGDVRESWTTWVGSCKSNQPSSLPQFVATEAVKFDPGEDIKRVLFTEISSYTITEVKDV
jgi:hypothetical protein